jgi:hypothetical protein
VERGRGWALVQGDCLQALESLPPHSVDVAFADPPYHLSNGGTTCRSGRRASVDKGRWDASRGVVEDHAFQSRWLAAVRRALKPGGTYLVQEINISNEVGENIRPLGKMVYSVSTLYCMTTSLAHGGAGIGAAMGEPKARELASAAGFSRFARLPVKDDFAVLYELRH